MSGWLFFFLLSATSVAMRLVLAGVGWWFGPVKAPPADAPPIPAADLPSRPQLGDYRPGSPA